MKKLNNIKWCRVGERKESNKINQGIADKRQAFRYTEGAKKKQEPVIKALSCA
jgi:hypothetical protein